MAITNWPNDERPREKLLRCGAGALSDAELLAIFLRTGVRGKSAVDLSRDLLRKYGGLRQILLAERETLATNIGLGPAKCALLHAALEIGKRYLAQKLVKEGPLVQPTDAADYLIHQLRDRPREVFAILYLDSRNYVLSYDEVFLGSLNHTPIHPREVVRGAIRYNAAAVILAHNHPSGVAEPSNADAILTARLKNALKLIEVRLLDHLVIGDSDYVSMSQRGLF